MLQGNSHFHLFTGLSVHIAKTAVLPITLKNIFFFQPLNIQAITVGRWRIFKKWPCNTQRINRTVINR